MDCVAVAGKCSSVAVVVAAIVAAAAAIGSRRRFDHFDSSDMNCFPLNCPKFDEIKKNIDLADGKLNGSARPKSKHVSFAKQCMSYV